MSTTHGKIVALSGGIGGAKLALGLSRVMAPELLTVIANTGDDFEHFGLTISPDVDTLVYTLAGIANRKLGWGRAGETWTFMQVLRELGGEHWFNLGDGDLAVHVMRTSRLANGDRPTEITRSLARALGVKCHILPMADTPVRTFVDSDQGRLAFQDYFVRRKCAPKVLGLEYAGADRAELSAEIREVLNAPDLNAIVICPSNPLISIDPILAVPGMREALRRARAPIVAVSPIIAGRAVKGPTAKMLDELGFGATATAVGAHYRGLIDAFIVETEDQAAVVGAGFPFSVHGAKTMMTTLADREALARTVLEVGAAARHAGGHRLSRREPAEVVEP